MTPVDLSLLTSSSDTASLVTRSDARGGVTVWVVDREGGVVATAFHADGTVDGAPLVLPAPPQQDDTEVAGDAGSPPPPPTVHDVEATPSGWLVRWDANPSAGWVGAYDPTGKLLYTVALATNAATIDLGADGTLGINDGASIGWVAPGQWTEQIAVTYSPAAAGSFDQDPGRFAAWGGGIAYVAAADLSTNIETVAAGGATYDHRVERRGESGVLVEVRGLAGRVVPLASRGNEVAGALIEFAGASIELAGRVKQLRSEPEQARSELRQLRREPEQLRSELRQLRSELEELGSKLRQLRSELEELGSKLRQARSEPHELRSEPDELRSEPGEPPRELGEPRSFAVQLIWGATRALLTGFAGRRSRFAGTRSSSRLS